MIYDLGEVRLSSGTRSYPLYSPNAFDDDLLEGVYGIAHMAMDMDMDMNNHAIFEKTIRSNLRLLEAAAKKSTRVKSIVITSSLAACALACRTGLTEHRRY
jgi:nucleoside-diphosphate-sugar epimerase